MRLRSSFDAKPLEDGSIHPAEQIIGEVLDSSEKATVWLGKLALDDTAPAFAASVLRCLGRRKDVRAASWREELIRGALAGGDVQLRDAALQAAEEWGGSKLRSVLESHLPSEDVGWLADAMKEVIEDLRH